MPDETDDTRVEELPPDETGPVPVTVMETEPRWYGITPKGAVLAIGFSALGAGIVLLVLGSPVVGAVVLAAGVLVLALLAWRPVAKRLAGPADVGRTALSTRLAAGRRLAALRRELDALERTRDERLRALGEAVYRRDEPAGEPLRQELEELDRRLDETRAEIDRTVAEASERIQIARLGTAKTEAVALEPTEGGAVRPADENSQ